MTTERNYREVAAVTDLQEAGRLLVRPGGRTVALFYHEEEVYAVDNRCPHMGFPLSDGTVEDGMLTCPWHHARFELSCGDTFDPFADDVQTYPVAVQDGSIYVDPDPDREQAPADHWQERMVHGLREDIDLVVAKAVIGLDDAGVDPAVPVRVGVDFGTRYRHDGWGRGLTTLAAMASIIPSLSAPDRRRALYTGLTSVAADCAGEPPFFVQDALSATDLAADRLQEWFRRTIEVRDSDGAERVLRAAIRADVPQSAIAEMLVAATTDHRYLDDGHRLDFLNKALETLDLIGWEYADEVLPSLVPALAAASRAEETSSWRQPVDLAALCVDAAAELPELRAAGADSTWEEPDDFVDVLLGDDPHAIVEGVTGAIADGASATHLGAILAYGAARRIAQFGTTNQFSDWNTVHHTFTYANAVHELARRTDGPATYRAVLDGAINVYLDRFLNVPPTPLPEPTSDRDPEAVLDDLREPFEVEAHEEVDRAGRLTATFLESGGDVSRLGRTLTEVLVREDVGFHARQNLEAALNLATVLAPDRRGVVPLIATARYLAAHTPTRRSGEQTYSIAARLHRGERIHET